MDVRLFAVGTLFFLRVIGERINLALGKAAQASSVYTVSIPVHPSFVTDGSDDSDWHSGSCFGTAFNDLEPWWMVDLQDVYTITGFMVISRSDCCPPSLSNFTVETFLENPADVPAAAASECFFYSGYPVLGKPKVVNCDNQVQGRYFRVRRSVKTNNDSLILCEIEVYEARKGPMCNKFTCKKNARVSHDKSIAVESPVQCAEACSNMLCLAFNFRWAEVPECQIVPYISGQPEYNQGWRFFKRNDC